MEIDNLLVTIAGILGRLKIPYIVTGSMALAAWGRVRATWDVDIVIELLPKNIPLLVKELLKVDKDVYVSEGAIKEALERKGEFNFIDPNSGLKVDFWIVKDVFNKQALKRGKVKDVDGHKVMFTSPEDLVLSKLLWYKESQSTRQLEDIEGVLHVSKVNMPYVKRWAAKHGTQDVLEKVVKKVKKEKP